MLKVAIEDDKYLVSLFHVKKINILYSDLISNQLNNIVEVPGRQVIFNLADIHFIDSDGFRALLMANDIARNNGTSFKLCNLNKEVKELIEVTGLSETLEIIPDIEVKEKILLELDY